MSLRTWLLIPAIAGVAGPRASAQARPTPLAGLEAYIERARRDWAVPGVAVAVVKDDSVVFAKGFGTRRADRVEPVDAGTVFAIASVTKTFTGTLAAMLVGEGVLGWDDRVTRWLPGFELYDPYATREITLRDLLAHRSGLGQRGDMLWYMSSYSRDEVVRRIRFLPPNAGFRSEVGYQNILFTAAGLLLAAVGGKSWDQLVVERIFRPLGMTESSTGIRDLESRSNLATPHRIVDGWARPVPWKDAGNIGPAGSINSSVRDLASYLRFHLADGAFRGQRLVSAALLAETKTPQIYLGGMGDGSTDFVAEGLGWVVEGYRGRKIVRHDGGIDGMLAELWTVPEERLGLVVLTNGEPHMLAPAIRLRILDAYLGAPPRDWNPEFLQHAARARAGEREAERKLAAARKGGTKPSLPLDRYVGTYQDPMYGGLEVTRRPNGLVARYHGFSAPLDHWHFDTFRGAWAPGYLAGTAFFTFLLDDRGVVSALEVEHLASFRRASGER